MILIYLIRRNIFSTLCWIEGAKNTIKLNQLAISSFYTTTRHYDMHRNQKMAPREGISAPLEAL